MSFRAYLDNIQAKTGKRPQEIAGLVKAQGLTKPSDIIAWVKSEFDRGHSRAIVSLLRGGYQPKRSGDKKVVAYFSGAKARWRTVYDRVVEQAQASGPDVSVSPGVTCLSLVKGEKNFAVVQAVGERMAPDIKLRGVPAEGRLEDAGAWNTMVRHRVRITDEAQMRRSSDG